MASKTLLVAQREYLENVRTKTFWLGILSLPVIIAVSIGIAWLMQRTKKLQEYAVLDYSTSQVAAEVEQAARNGDLQRTLDGLMGSAKGTGQPGAEATAPPTEQELLAQLDEAAAKLPPEQPLRGLIDLLRADPKALLQLDRAGASGRPELPPELLGKVFRWMGSLTPQQRSQLQTMASARKYRHVSLAELGIADLPRDQQLERCNRMIDDGRLFAYFVFDHDPVADSDKKDGSCIYVSDNLTDDNLREWYADAATQVVRGKRIAKAGIPLQTARSIQEELRFLERRPGAGSSTENVEREEKANKFAPVAFVYLLWIAVFTAAQMLLTNTVEEKSNRIIEVLLSSASPGELMSGKIWGIGATGLTIVGSWVVFAILGVWLAPRLVPSLAEMHLGQIVGDPLYLVSFIAYFLTGYLLFAAILVAIGSVCNSLKEAQNLLQPVFILLMLPLFAMIPIVQEPNGLMARVFTYVPIYTPFAMMNRASGPPPAWEYAVTSVLILVSVLVAFRAAGKVFRIGVLMTGNPPKLKEILGWLRER